MKYVQALVGSIILIVIFPPFKKMWDAFAPSMIAEVEDVAVYEQFVINYFPYIFLALCITAVFVVLKMASHKED